MMMLDRRSFVGAALAAPFVSRTALGQNAGQIVMANFGGGVAEAFNEAYGKPFTAETGIGFKVQEVPSTETALISSASQQQYNSSYHSYSGAMRLYKMGIVEGLAVDEFPALQAIPKEYLPFVDDKHVAGIPCHFAFYGIAFNSDDAKASDFRSWRSLTAEKWKERVTVTSPVFASLYDVPWYSKLFGGDQKKLDAGVAQYKAVVKNSLTTYNSMAQNQQLLQRGDATACAYYSSRIWDIKGSGVKNVEVTIPEEGALMIPYVLVIPKNCPFPEAARKFANYGGTAPPVERGLQKTGSLPLTTAAKVPDELLKKNFGYTLAEIKSRTFNPDWAFIQETRDGVIERLQRELAAAK
jgi:putative spermidine/putrescine transport system substrate-binding protein